MSTADNKPASPETRAPLVLFDGSCPLCSREIAHYRRLRGADRVEWLDISADNTAMPIDGIERDTAMARFHVRDADGNWHTGAFGFAELWRHLPGYRIVGGVLRSLRLLPLLDRAYAYFARWRSRRQCDQGSCQAASASQGRPPGAANDHSRPPHRST